MAQPPLHQLRQILSGDQQSLLMIPGPVEMSPNALEAMSEKTVSHVSAGFCQVFAATLTDLRAVFQSGPDSNAYVISGSGSLGWEFIGANFMNPGDKALVLSAGYFGTSFKDVLTVYKAEVEQFDLDPLGLSSQSVTTLRKMEALEEAGQTLNPSQREERKVAQDARLLELENQIKAIVEKIKGVQPKIVCMTHVDTSTGYCTPIRSIISACKESLPEDKLPLFAVDGVCSIGGERLLMSEWGVDIAFTGSQKALGVPPGLMLLLESARAASARLSDGDVKSYYCNMHKWNAIMQSYAEGKPKYYATPAVNLVYSLFVALRQLLRVSQAPEDVNESKDMSCDEDAMRVVWSRHQKSAEQIWRALKALRCSMLVPDPSRRAVTLTAFTLGASRTNPQFIDVFRTALRYPARGQDLNKVTIAGGLLRALPEQFLPYFRMGHMGVSSFHRSSYNHLQNTVRTLAYAIQKSFPDGHVSSLSDEECESAVRALNYK